jgi:hypothetical protein
MSFRTGSELITVGELGANLALRLGYCQCFSSREALDIERPSRLGVMPFTCFESVTGSLGRADYTTDTEGTGSSSSAEVSLETV